MMTQNYKIFYKKSGGTTKKKRVKLYMPDFYNHLYTVNEQVVVDEAGLPVPWFNYPAINYLKQIDISTWSVFEYGCGASTRFWSANAKNVVTVEHEETWAKTIQNLDLPNVMLMIKEGNDYVRACECGAPHDLIVVDGRWRYDCALACLQSLSRNGMIILDNAERYPTVTQHFRDHGFIQIDFIGTGPIARHTWATSIFLSRTVDLRPARKIQPHNSAGMVDSIETRPELAKVNCAGSF